MRKKTWGLLFLILVSNACKQRGSATKGIIDAPDSILVEQFLNGYDTNCPTTSDEQKRIRDKVISSMNAVVKVEKLDNSSATGFLVAPSATDDDPSTRALYVITNQHVLAPITNEYCMLAGQKLSDGPEPDWIYQNAKTKCTMGSPRTEVNDLRLRTKVIDVEGAAGTTQKQTILVTQEDADTTGAAIRVRTRKKMFYEGDIAFQKGACTSTYPIYLNFGYYESSGDNRPAGLAQHERIKCAKVLIANQEHDFAVLQLEKAPANTQMTTYQPLELDIDTPKEDEDVFLVGHPEGLTKRMALTNHKANDAGFNLVEQFFDMSYACHVKPAKYPDNPILQRLIEVGEDPALRMRYPHTLLHNCDTMYGSSGSPVFRRSQKCLDGKHDLEVVGLHWNGWQVSKGQFFDKDGETKDNGQYTDGKSAQDPNREVEEDDIFRNMPYSKANSMIRISEIRDYLKKDKKFDSEITEESLTPVMGEDAKLLAKDVANICQEGVSYIDDLAKKLTTTIMAQCSNLKTFYCKDSNKNLCSCAPDNIRWKKAADNCELVINKCSNPKDLLCSRLKQSCVTENQREATMWENAKTLIDNHHVCYTGQQKLAKLKEIFHIDIEKEGVSSEVP
ncbi:MAG: serine protease [Oligoflexales bacterium]